MSQIGWNESNPPDTESAGLGDDRIRSLMTSVRQGLAAEHTWPSAGGDAGIHLLGSARAFVGTQSQVSSSGTDGRLMMTSDTSRLFHVGSAGTSLVGGPTAILAANFPGTVPQRHVWVEEFGLDATGPGSSGVFITIPNSGYSGQPLIFLSAYTNSVAGGRNPALMVHYNGASNFSVSAWDATFSLSAGSTPFFWRSIGSRVL